MVEYVYMAYKERIKQKDKDALIPPLPHADTLRMLGAVILATAGVVLAYGLFGKGGKVGNELFTFIQEHVGVLVFGVPLLLFSFAYYLWKKKLPQYSVLEYVFGSITLLSVLVLGSQLPLPASQTGGLFGIYVFTQADYLFGYAPAIFIASLACLGSLFFLFRESPLTYLFVKVGTLLVSSGAWIGSKIRGMKKTDDAVDEEIEDEEGVPEPVENINTILRQNAEKQGSVRETLLRSSQPVQRDSTLSDIKDTDKDTPKKAFVPDKNFTPPPLSLLEKDRGKASVGDIKENANTIKRTLQNFGITVEMDEIAIGPSVTRYALKPAQGVKLSRIVGLQNELALDLAVESIRVEAPIPGKSLVGIEIPNESKSMVGLGSLLGSDEYTKNPNPLLIALGKGISGKALYVNMAKLPHLLIAGTTGSGKSSTIHAVIQSLLFRNSPYDLKLIMIDPKKVELTLYNDIPHLYTPVITTAKKTIQTLNWAVQEMERRYDILEAESEQDIRAYHNKVYAPALEKVKKGTLDEENMPDKLPYIVIIIDELADIMMTYPKELESGIVRLAQKSRAVGIHLILSTQRPEVKVITGLIKANIPSRVALKVASQIDSRTIIDGAGAEKLLGAGDMLFTSSESPKPERVQSAFVSNEEIKRVVNYLKQAYRTMIPDTISIVESASLNAGSIISESISNDGGEDDELYEQAKELVVSSRKGSTSYLQRRFKIGYSRAARLIDLLEKNGVVGPQDGAKPRTILIGGGSPSAESFGLSADEVERV